MDRRLFLKLTGVAVAAAGAAQALPASAAVVAPEATAARSQARAPISAPSTTRVAVGAPGTYQISGQVRLLEPTVEISGIAHTQRISWSEDIGPEGTLVSFVTFEQVDARSGAPEIVVRGGRLEGVSVTPLVFQ